MAEKQTNKERLKDITDSIEQGIQDLFQSDKYAEYLRTMSRFHKYSVNNTMLIYVQKPDVTLVAGFNKWRDQFERNVLKGEKGIKIIAPTPTRKRSSRKSVTRTPICPRWMWKEETKAKKPSVLAKLRQYQKEDREQTTQHRSAERDLI